MYEWIGIVGSIMIIIAFTRKDEKTIRLLDAIGAVLFIVYGILTRTWATAFLNMVLVIVHAVRFCEMRRDYGKSKEPNTKLREKSGRTKETN